MDFDKSLFDEVKHTTKVIFNDAEYEGFGTGKTTRGHQSFQLGHEFNIILKCSSQHPEIWR
ncbi:hypothetical protein BO70DRAFT_394693 [Aspergillus heteromorphus CBS 117.55]|uniref:Uncharacterized protein n=1 Tax=Aspergillus heteromorphus CBS 117.55 TaxID=1448321 RepID=A0A317WKT6_9EURO|nr:uncharacterized protein BO70DRAFT_394693 [Aspergillus heteromorphus CBS 117.55]PWY86675.1 hypothetical protein BO70DRAFT_394693 [Aspergillus heteromorphus CBS 117.55]